MQQNHFDIVKIKKSRPKIITLVILLFSIVLLGLWMLSNAEFASRPASFALAGMIALVFFGPMAIFYLRILFFMDEVTVEFSPEGLVYRKFLKRRIAWEDIQHIRVTSKNGSSFIMIKLSSEAKRSAIPIFWRLYFSVDAVFGFRGVPLSSNELKIDFSELCDLMEYYLKKFNPNAIDVDWETSSRRNFFDIIS
jgi:hypothetical protein